MIARNPVTRRTLHLELVKPSHYDDDGYVIQWHRAAIPSNSLACLYSLAEDLQERRGLGDDIDVVTNAYDEIHTVIPVQKIVQRIQDNGGLGMVMLVGVQSNQFPRACDLAKQFRDAGVAVAIGGFHVSGCISMLPEVPDDIQALMDSGVTVFCGEAEGRLDGLLGDYLRGEMKPLYNYLDDLPGLDDTVMPVLPDDVVQKYMASFSCFDAGRGCPFKCSFCTIINVQGRVSRWREADAVEHMVRENFKRGIRRFFVTDDNFARNRNWEAIFDRLIYLREEEGIRVKMLIQVDTMCHKVPNFIEKAARAGVNRVYIGLENINPDNLVAAQKHQNKIEEYRDMLLQWRQHRVVTYAGYILGFPADTPEGITRDIETIKRVLPVDILEFFNLTPLPGSEDHKVLQERGVWMDPDMNKYDLEHVTTAHPTIPGDELERIYDRAWKQYYTDEHIETLLRRAYVCNSTTRSTAMMIAHYYGAYRFERLHPLQAGIWRRKVRKSRRPTMKLENPLIFYPRRVWEVLRTYVPFGMFVWKLHHMRKRIDKDPARWGYHDDALPPVDENGEIVIPSQKVKKGHLVELPVVNAAPAEKANHATAG